LTAHFESRSIEDVNGEIKGPNLQRMTIMHLNRYPQLGYSQDADSGDRGGLEGKTNRGITVPLKSLGIAGRAELNVIITSNGAQTPNMISPKLPATDRKIPTSNFK
jgi:hypothetical protein